MKLTTLFLSCIFGLNTYFVANDKPIQEQSDDKVIEQIYHKELLYGSSYENLRHLCKNIGHRLSGSSGAAAAEKWAQQTLSRLADTVYLQPVSVSQWIRGRKQTAEVVLQNNIMRSLKVCALGGSPATPTQGVKGELLVVEQLSQLAALGEKGVKNKIVFFNRPMSATKIDPFDAYSEAVEQRVNGPAEAAKYGAAAAIVRSMTHKKDDYPHTGITMYQTNFSIPAVAISTVGADFLNGIGTDNKTNVSINLECATKGEVTANNVIAEIKGSKFPNEIILVGAHLHSWDVGEGAHDDGAGVVHVMEVLHLYKKLKIKPLRTIRIVLFTNEENGGRGAKKYAEESKRRKEMHIAAIESDRGGFAPHGFEFDGNDLVRNQCLSKVQSWKNLFSPYRLHHFEAGGGGADIDVLREQNVPLIGFVPDPQRYFDYHHCETDVFEAVNKRELELGAASITSLVYLLDKYGLK